MRSNLRKTRIKLAPLHSSAADGGSEGENNANGQMLQDMLAEWVGKLKEDGSGTNTNAGKVMLKPIESHKSAASSSSASSISANTPFGSSSSASFSSNPSPTKSTDQLPRIIERGSAHKYTKSKNSVKSSSASVGASSSGSVSNTISDPASVYGVNIVPDGVPPNKVNMVLLQIGEAVHKLSDAGAIYDITTVSILISLRYLSLIGKFLVSRSAAWSYRQHAGSLRAANQIAVCLQCPAIVTRHKIDNEAVWHLRC
jgi:hypothetical protein